MKAWDCSFRFSVNVLCLGLSLSISSIVYALSPGAAYVGPDNVFQTRNSNGTFLCGLINGRWLAGALDKSDRDYFVSYAAQIRTLRQRARTEEGIKKERTLARISTLRSRSSRGGEVCRNGDDGGSTPTPKPTTTPSLGNFDSVGNVTAKGKQTFGIPSNLSGNVSKGKTVHSTKCTGCHSEHTNLTFSQYRTWVGQFPMSYTTSSLPDGELADITAYLNRFRLQ